MAFWVVSIAAVPAAILALPATRALSRLRLPVCRQCGTHSHLNCGVCRECYANLYDGFIEPN